MTISLQQRRLVIIATIRAPTSRLLTRLSLHHPQAIHEHSAVAPSPWNTRDPRRQDTDLHLRHLWKCTMMERVLLDLQ